MKKVMLIVSFLLVLTMLLFACKKVPSDETLTPSGNETTAETLGELTTDTRSVIAESNAPSETREMEESEELSETEETTKPVETKEPEETGETVETEETAETDETPSGEPVFIVSYGDTDNVKGITPPEIWIDEAGRLFIKVGFVNKTGVDVYLNDYRTLRYREDSRWVTCSLAEEAEISNDVTRVGLGGEWSEVYELTGVFDLSKPGAYRFQKDPFLWVEFKLTEGIGEGAESDTGSQDEAPTTQAPGDLELLANIPEADQSIVGQTQTIRLVDYYFIYLCNTETGEERLAVSHRGLCDSPMSYSTMTVYAVELGGLEGLKAACEGEVSGTVLATAGIGRLDGFYFKGRIFSDYGRDPSEMFYAKDETAENRNALQFYFGGYDPKKEDVFLRGNMVATVSEALQEDYDYTRRAYIERVGLLDAFDILSLNYGHYERLTWR